MNSGTFVRKALTSLLSVTILVTYSMVALAAPAKSIGELTVSGKDVRVNGEVAQSGRTIFSASTITTSESSGATINLNEGGSVEISNGSSVSAGSSDSFTLIAGKITSYSDKPVNVVFNGKSVKLSNGESTAAAFSDDQRDANGKCVDTDGDGKLECDDSFAGAWWIWTLIFGGAAAGIIIAALSDNNRVALGGGTTVVSPTR